MQFCLDVYSAPPSAVIFLQDDPTVPLLRSALTSPGWADSLSRNFIRRAAARGDARAVLEPWWPEPCPCSVIREDFFTPSKYGGYRPIAWWLRTFLAPFRNATSLPHQLRWPQTAQ